METKRSCLLQNHDPGVGFPEHWGLGNPRNVHRCAPLESGKNHGRSDLDDSCRSGLSFADQEIIVNDGSPILIRLGSEKFQVLKELGYFEKKSSSQIMKRDLLEIQTHLREEIATNRGSESVWRAISVAAGLMKLQYGQELFESQEISAAHTYFYNFFREGGDSSKAAEELRVDTDFRRAFEMISDMKDKGISHPKLLKLKEIVQSELKEKRDLRIIVFNQYRDTAQKIVQELSKIGDIRPTVFVGQAKKGEVKMSQKEQKAILQDFRDGEFNVLVSTSVGEEGLDIPKVDMVVFYEPVASAIRTIQRIGRTGRFDKGKAYVLMSEGTRDVITSHIANAKEKKMYRTLSEVQDEFEGKKKDSKKSLNRFLGDEDEKNERFLDHESNSLSKNHG